MEYADDGDSESELLGPLQVSSSSAEARDADQSETDEKVAPLGILYELPYSFAGHLIMSWG